MECGVGLVVNRTAEDGLVVAEVVSGGPASRVGAAQLRAGDVIVAVDDQPLQEGAGISDLSRVLRGPEGSKVTLTVSRPTAGGSQQHTVVLERGRVIGGAEGGGSSPSSPIAARRGHNSNSSNNNNNTTTTSTSSPSSSRHHHNHHQLQHLQAENARLAAEVERLRAREVSVTKFGDDLQEQELRSVRQAGALKEKSLADLLASCRDQLAKMEIKYAECALVCDDLRGQMSGLTRDRDDALARLAAQNATMADMRVRIAELQELNAALRDKAMGRR